MLETPIGGWVEKCKLPRSRYYVTLNHALSKVTIRKLRNPHGILGIVHHMIHHPWGMGGVTYIYLTPLKTT